MVESIDPELEEELLTTSTSGPKPLDHRLLIILGGIAGAAVALLVVLRIACMLPYCRERMPKRVPSWARPSATVREIPVVLTSMSFTSSPKKQPPTVGAISTTATPPLEARDVELDGKFDVDGTKASI